MKHNNLRMLLGPPGTGKTTELLNIVEREIKGGAAPERIAFLAFTKKAATEAQTRAADRFGYKPEQLPYFRTIHSLTFRQLGLRREQMVSWQHYKELSSKLGMEITGKTADDDTGYGMSKADRLMFIEGLARVTNQPLKDVCAKANEPDIDYWELERFARAYALFKQNKRLTDFTDTLHDFCAAGTVAVPALDVLIIDEGQDLSISQWHVIERLAEKAKRVYCAFDEDQAIYKWSGADVEYVFGLEGETRVLDQSYRVPRAVHDIASRVVNRIGRRIPKAWKPRQEPGQVNYLGSPEEADLSKGSWLLLARNGYMLNELTELCMRQGFTFNVANRKPLHEQPSLKAITSWTRLCRGESLLKKEIEPIYKYRSATLKHLLDEAPKDKPLSLSELRTSFGLIVPTKDPPIWWQALDRIPVAERDFFIAARRRGETLTKTPRITVSTIHTVKGGEADNILLLSDISQRTYDEMSRDGDSEHRVFYVAVTRARETLNIVQPKSGLSYTV